MVETRRKKGQAGDNDAELPGPNPQPMATPPSTASAKPTAPLGSGKGTVSKAPSRRKSTQKKKVENLEEFAEKAVAVLPTGLKFAEEEKPGKDDDGVRLNMPKSLPEDKMGARIEEAYLGTVRMCVVPLNPRWGTGTGANRPISQANVDKLTESFKVGVRRYNISTRMKASIIPAVFTKVLAWNQSQLTASNTTNIRDLAQEAKGAHYSLTKELIPEIQWVDEDVDFDDPNPVVRVTQPTLEAGQHRRAALLQHFRMDGSLDEWIDTRAEWAVDFYNASAFDAEVRNALRTNKEDVFLSASDGEMMAAFIETWMNLPPNRRQQIEGDRNQFRAFLDSVGYTEGNRTRIPNITRNKVVCLIMNRFVQYQWGKQVFALSAFDKMAGSRLDQFWKEWFDTHVFSPLIQIFGSNRYAVTRNDINLLTRAWGEISTEMYTFDTLKPLFFPSNEDVRSKQSRWLTSADKLKGLPFFDLGFDGPQMANLDADRRHPSFLRSLNDKAYYAVFCRLLNECKHVQLMEWQHGIAPYIRRVEGLIPKIMTHVIYWFSLTWRKPANAKKELVEFSYISTIEDELFQHRNTHRAKRGKNMEPAEAALAYCHDLIDLAMANYPLWSEKSLEGWLEPPYTTFGETVVPDLGPQYRQRFMHSIWIDVALLTADWTGWTWVLGYMAPYKAPSDFEEDRKPYTVWGASLARTMASQNFELHKLKSVLNPENLQVLEREGSLFGAAYSYYILKKALTEKPSDEGSVPTPGGKSSKNKPLTEEESNAVRAQLEVYSSFLNRNGYNTNPASLDEPTNHLLFSSKAPPTGFPTPRRHATAADLARSPRTPAGHKRTLSRTAELPNPKFSRLGRRGTPKPTDEGSVFGDPGSPSPDNEQPIDPEQAIEPELSVDPTLSVDPDLPIGPESSAPQ